MIRSVGLAIAIGLGFAAPAPGADAPAAPGASRPNFVFFLTDDQRADALSMAGHPLLETPHIDRIGREGMAFRNAFVTNALCTPSRACFLTGKYGHTTGCKENAGEPARLPLEHRTVAEVLREHGYEVAFVGKSHIAGNLRDRPWDYYFGFRGQGRYHDPVVAESDGSGAIGPDRPYKGDYMDDLLGDKAAEYLRRPKEKPFCLFVWFKAPHRPWERAERYKTLYEGKAAPEPPTFRAGYEGKSRSVAEADMKIGDFDDVRDLDSVVKDYCATIKAVDDNVGKVLGALDDRGLAGETAVIYSSDNGFFLGEFNFFDKRLMYEPSIRVPMLVRLPDRVAAGSARDEMVLNLDVAPTMLELAGVPAPPNMQGRSFAPLLRGESPAWRDAWLYEYYEYPLSHKVKPHRGVRTDRWKLMHFFTEPEEWELYDLQSDPDERTNLHGRPEHAEVEAKLRERLAGLRRETGDPDLGEN